MNCTYLRKRQKNYKSYWYCKKGKEQITLEKCKECSMIEYKPIKEIKKRSKKQARNEKNRFSIVQSDMKTCYFCGEEAESIHELIGGIYRQTSIKWWLCVGACLKCHRLVEDNEKIKQKYQVIGQEIFVKKFGIELFIKEFKRNYKEKRCNK